MGLARFAALLVLAVSCSKADTSRPDGSPQPGRTHDGGGADVAVAPLDAATQRSDASPEPDGSDTTDAAGQDLRYSEWTNCGEFDESNPASAPVGQCLCNGVNQCEAVRGLGWFEFTSEHFRVCGKANGACEVAVFTEREGAGVGRRCTLPLGTTPCNQAPLRAQAIMAKCVDTFSCNLLQENCPADLTPCK